MIRTLMTTTALAALIATSSIAQDAMMFKADESNMLGTKFIGMEVYSGQGEEAESIGEIDDIVLNPEGQVDAVIIGVGGFLGIGEKKVAIPFDQIEMTEAEGKDRLSANLSREQLEGAEEFDASIMEPEPAEPVAGSEPAVVAPADPAAEPVEGEQPAAEAVETEQPAEETPAEQPAAEAPAEQPAAEAPAADAPAEQPAAETETTTTEVPIEQPAEGEQPTEAEPAEQPAEPQTETAVEQPAEDPAVANQVVRDELQPVNMDEISAEKFIGTRVYGVNEENVGEIGDMVMSSEGQIDSVIIDVGGFLGIGEKPVAVAFEDLEFLQDENGSLYLYTEFSEEQLEQQPEYNADEYGDRREEMRMRRTQ